jgi:teichoic acid ribitol-phosphate primase
MIRGSQSVEGRVKRLMLLLVRVWSVRIAFIVGRLLPLRRRIVIATSHDPDLRGNLAVIRDALAAEHPDIPIIVATRRQPTDDVNRLRILRRALTNGITAGYRLARTRLFIVDDYYFPIYVIRPRAGTTIVQTWHAAGAFKKFGYSVLDKAFGADELLVSRVAIHSNYDVCLVSSMSFAPQYAEAFGQPLDGRFRSDIGMPRTDALFDDAGTARAVAAVRARYAIPDGRRVVLYAPTFRGESVSKAEPGVLLDLRLLQSELTADHVLLLRLHPFVRTGFALGDDLAGFVIDVSDHPDINELLPVADVLITDYSSVMYEYALLRRPMLFFAPDLDEYHDERGFYFDYRTGVPGPVIRESAEVARWLRSGDFDRDRVDAFARASFDVADGHATARFIERIVLPVMAE